MRKYIGCVLIWLILLFSACESTPEKEGKTPLDKTAGNTEAAGDEIMTTAGETMYVITDFEDPDMYMRLYNGEKSTFNIAFTTQKVKSGNRAVKVEAKTIDYTGVEILIPEGKGDWSALRTIKMWIYGDNSGTEIKVVYEDSQKEMFTFSVFDDFTGWKEVSLPIRAFKSRTDWQAEDAIINQEIDFPIYGLHYFTANGGEGTFYFDLITVTDEGKPRIPGEVEEFVELITPLYALKDLAADYGLSIGAAATPAELKVEKLQKVLARDFDSVTAGNELKFYTIRAEQDSYNFGPADEMMKFAEDNNMKMRGHTLVWHNSPPQWLAEGNFSKEEMLDILREFITTTVARYKGRIWCWDVANEVFEENGSLRSESSVWARVCGDEYIEKAFMWAHEADPDAKLFINDYGVEGINSKSNGMYDYVKILLDKGVPVDGVGLQAHVIEESPPSFKRIYDNVKRFVELGLEVHFTEMDIRIKGDVTEEKLEHQAELYGEFMRIALAFEEVTNITTWGVSDAYTWITTHFPGYKEPLLFDKHFNPKPAYYAFQVALVSGPEELHYEDEYTGRHLINPFKAEKASRAPEIDGNAAPGEWDKAIVYPFSYNQLSGSDQRVPETSDLDGNWRTLYNDNVLYGLVKRTDEMTVTDMGNSWENDNVEIFFGINDNFVQLRVIVGQDFEGHSYAGARKAAWSAAGDTLEFSIEMQEDLVQGKIIGWNIALSDNDGNGGRDHQLYPVTGSNIGWQGEEFAEIEFVSPGQVAERLGKAHIVNPFRAVHAASAPVIDGKIGSSEWNNAVIYQCAVNQLSTTDLTRPDTIDLKGDWRILYNGNIIYGLVQRSDETTHTSAPNSWENDTVEVFFDLNNEFVQLRTLVGQDFEGHAYKGARKAVWSAAGDILEFSVALPASDLKGLLSGWNIALADNDGTNTREHQLYPINGTNNSWQGIELGEIQFK